MGITPLTFTGISQFSNDFQTILTRAVSIASLPVKALQNQQTDLLQKKQLTGSLNAAVSDLADSVAALGRLGGNKALVGSSSDTTKIAINSTSASAPATYTINVTSVAKAAAETSISGYATTGSTTVSAKGTLDFTFGATTKPITLDSAHNNLAGLRDAINGLGLGVTASILTAGSTNYLSVTANGMGANALRLVDHTDSGDVQLLTSQNQGANAEFTVNGAFISQTSNLVNSVVPGVAFTVLDNTTSPVTVTLNSANSSLTSALKDLASKYNAVKQQLDAQIGPNAGLLSGNSIIHEIQAGLRSLMNYNGTGAGSIQGLAALGIELSKSGDMSFNQDTFDQLTSAQVQDAYTFLGSATTGFGALAGKLTQISDPILGAIKVQQDQFDAADRRISDQISTLTDRIDTMQKGLVARLQQADALLANLQSQQSILTSSIQGLNYTSFGKAPQNQ